jgi:hypothetical protein
MKTNPILVGVAVPALGRSRPPISSYANGSGAEGQFLALGLDEPTGVLRNPFAAYKAAFESVDLPYFPPHFIRDLYQLWRRISRAAGGNHRVSRSAQSPSIAVLI